MNISTKIIKPEKIHNFLYHVIGLVLLFLNKIRHSIEGYKNPREFPITNFKQAIEYDQEIIKKWLEFLNSYQNTEFSIRNKNILELGPGADLGIGLLLLSKGIKKYNALDINNLVKSVPDEFYNFLFDEIAKTEGDKIEADALRNELQATQKGDNNNLNYVYDKDFNISVFNNEDIDIIFSQAAFEHFDDVDNVIAQLSKISKPGTIFIGEIDLKTHTRWIREKDPLNIFRFSNLTYNLFKFSGSPNRIRPFEFGNMLETNDWDDIQILPLTKLSPEYYQKVRNSLNKKFRNEKNQMDYLTFLVCATKQ